MFDTWMDIKKFPQYAGISYEKASREASRLIKLGWYRNFDKLKMLRDVMEYEMRNGRNV